MTRVLLALTIVSVASQVRAGDLQTHDDVSLKFGLNLEAMGVLVNRFREGGGNEMSIGDFLIGITLDGTYDISDTSKIGLHFDWVPEQLVLNFADPGEVNSHNEHWLRADGYVSRPSILAHIGLEGQLSEDIRGEAKLGAFLAGGLEGLGVSDHYLSTPAPLMHTQHYDKGIQLGLSASWLRLSASVIDGDWAVGEADVFATHNSAANSYPSYAGGIELLSPWGLYAGFTGTYGDLGSNPGQKRRQDNAVVYAGGRWEHFEVRGFGTRAWRNPEGDSSGRNVSAVRMDGYGMEATLRDIKLGEEVFDVEVEVSYHYNL